MLRALMADAIFIAAVLIETMAALSLLQSGHAIALPEAFEPVLAFYRNQALSVLAPGAGFLSAVAPYWLADASIIASVLFFLFFIRQARHAMSPHGGEGVPEPGGAKLDRSELIIDWILPAAACAIGALVTAPTLLPFLTVPAAIFLAARKLSGLSNWFEISRSFFANLLCFGAALGGSLLLLPR